MDTDQIHALKQGLRDDGYNIYVYSYPGGMCFPPHMHDHETIHIVLSGSMKITLDEVDHILVPAERSLVPSHKLHTAEVLGETPVVILDATPSRI